MSTHEQRLRMAETIKNFEARRDRKGRLQVYYLPPGDGGGKYEVAGINQRYNKQVCDRPVALVNAGRYDEAEALATEFIANDTDPVESWSTIPAIESYLRDCCFNRGARGAAAILQLVVGVDVGVASTACISRSRSSRTNARRAVSRAPRARRQSRTARRAQPTRRRGGARTRYCLWCPSAWQLARTA